MPGIACGGQRRPRLLVLAVHASASPDRGTERLLRELLPLAGQVRLWPLPAGSADPGHGQQGAARWQRWLKDADLGPIECLSELAHPQAAATS